MQSAVHESFSLDFPTLSLNLFSNALDDRVDVVDLHWHGRLEIIHVIDGQGIITVDFSKFFVSKGDIVVVPPRALHMAQGRNDQLLVSQTAVFSLECIRANREYEPVIRPGMPGYDEIRQLMQTLFLPRQGSVQHQELLMQGYVTALYALLGCYGYEKRKSEKANDSNLAIKRVVTYIHEHYHEKLDVDTLAQIAGYSKYYFVRFFSNHIGCSCTYYIQVVRLSKAKELLRATGLSVTSVSEHVGFDSISYFIKVFKKQTGLTPLQYRIRHTLEQNK